MTRLICADGRVIIRRVPTIKGYIWLRCQLTVGKEQWIAFGPVCVELDCPNCTGGVFGGESCFPRVTLEAALQRGGRDGEDEEAEPRQFHGKLVGSR